VSRLSSVEARKQFNESQLSKIPVTSCWIWTDASVVPPRDDNPPQSGGAYIIMMNATEILRGTTSLGELACSYSMERETLYEAVEKIFDMVTHGHIRIPSLAMCAVRWLAS